MLDKLPDKLRDTVCMVLNRAADGKGDSADALLARLSKTDRGKADEVIAVYFPGARPCPSNPDETHQRPVRFCQVCQV